MENDSEEDEDSDPSNIEETIAKSNETIPPKLVSTMKEDSKIMERQIKVTIYRRGGPKTKKDASRAEERSESKRNKDGKY